MCKSRSKYSPPNHSNELPSRTDNVLSQPSSAADLMLSALRNAAANLNFALALREAAILALTIHESLHAACNSKDSAFTAFNALVWGSCNRVYAFISACNVPTVDGAEVVSTQLQSILEQLYSLLSDIKDFFQNRGRQNAFTRFWNYKHDLKVVIELSERMGALQGAERITTMTISETLQELTRENGNRNLSLEHRSLSTSSTSESPASIMPSSPSPGPDPSAGPSPQISEQFPNLFAGASQFSGHFQYTNIEGNHYVVHTEDHSTSSNFNNVYCDGNIDPNNNMCHPLPGRGTNEFRRDTRRGRGRRRLDLQ